MMIAMKNRFILLPRDFSNTPDRELGVFGGEQKKLVSRGISIPKCAIIPLKTLKSIAAANSIPEKISKVLVTTNFNDPVACTKLKKVITESINSAKIPKEILQELGEMYHEYFTGSAVTIFSSDSYRKSAERKHSGDATVIKELLSVWAESTVHSLFRSNTRHIHPPLLSHCLVIREVLSPTFQGLAYTRNPKTGVKTSAYIVCDMITKNSHSSNQNEEFEVDVRTWNIIYRSHRNRKDSSILNDNRILEIAKIANTIKKLHLEHKCIHWALSHNKVIVLDFEDFDLSEAHKQHHKTITQLYISAGNPQHAQEFAELPISGIGYLKSEYALLSLGLHPHAVIQSGRKNLIERAIVRTLSTFSAIPNISHIIYKAFDVPSEDLVKLDHATVYESDEQNSWLGVRGAGKALLQPALLETEIESLISFSKKNTTHISLLFPFVRSATELHRLLRLAQSRSLDRAGIETWMQIATLEPLLNILEYPLEHLGGISIQLDTVVQLLLGISPTHAYHDEYQLDPKVLKTVLQPFCTAVQKSSHKDVPIHIQMEHYNPDFAKLAIQLGVDAITVRPTVAPLAKACIIDTEAAPFRASSESSSKTIYI